MVILRSCLTRQDSYLTFLKGTLIKTKVETFSCLGACREEVLFGHSAKWILKYAEVTMDRLCETRSCIVVFQWWVSGKYGMTSMLILKSGISFSLELFKMLQLSDFPAYD